MRSSDLDTIRKRCRDDPDECFTEVIKCWLRGCEHKPTWSNIIAALKAKSVGFSDLAKEIEKKLQHMDTDHSEETKTEMDDNTKQANEFFHCPCGRCSLESYLEKGCQYTHSSNSLFPYLDVKNLDEDVKDDIIQTLNNDLAKIMNCFAELLDKTAVSIGRRGEPAVIVERLILRALSVGAFDHPCIQKPLLKENEIELKCSKTVDAAFIILRHHMSFFNFELLQHIINSEELCTHEDRKRMEVYCSKFDEFCRRKVFEVPPDVYGQPRSDCKRNSFVVLMTRHEEERNLICVRAAKHKIANILKLKVSTLHLHRIDEGSLLLVFSVPEFVAHCLFPLSDSLKAGLKEEGYIIYSTLSSEPCLFKDKEMPLINQLMLKDEPIKSHAISPIDDSSLLEDRHTSLREQPSNILLADYPYGKKNLILEEGYIIFSTLSSEPCLFKDKEMPLINQLTLKDEPIKSHAISPFDDSSLLEDRHTLLREQPSNIPPADYPYGKKKLILLCIVCKITHHMVTTCSKYLSTFTVFNSFTCDSG